MSNHQLSMESEQNIENPLGAKLQHSKAYDIKMLTRLTRRIKRELKTKKFVGDILVTDEEYQFLLNHTRERVLSSVDSNRLPPSNPLILVAMVQIGIRCYDGNFWKHAAQQLCISQLKNLGRYRTYLAEACEKTLLDFQKSIIKRGETVENILLQGYVSNHYADQYFNYLYAFYRLDLDRDLDQLTTEVLRDMIHTVLDDAAVGRTYLLREMVKDAISVNPIGCRLRIRRHLKLLDTLFWQDDFRINSANRINQLMQDWVDRTNPFESARAQSHISHRGKKAFSSPHLYYDSKHECFSIHLPSQLLKKEYGIDIEWRLEYSGQTCCFPADLVETVTGYRAEPAQKDIDISDIFSEFIFSLYDGTGQKLRTFNIPQEKVRFFAADGYSEKTSTLRRGRYDAFIPADTSFICSAELDRIRSGDYIRVLLDLENGDLVQLPNQKTFFVGRRVTDGFLTHNRIQVAYAYTNDSSEQSLAVYSAAPCFILTIPRQKVSGTLVVADQKRMHLTQMSALQLTPDDGSDNEVFFITLSSLFSRNGIHDILVDIPGYTKKQYSFLLLSGFHAAFDGAPYFFEPRGSVTFSQSLPLLPLWQGCHPKDQNQFDFEIDAQHQRLSFRLMLPGQTPVLELMVPAFFWQFGSGNWNAQKPEALWHAEFPSCIQIAAPCETLQLCMDSFANDYDEEGDADEMVLNGEKKADTAFFSFDTTRLKSYLYNGPVLRQLFLLADNKKMRFLDIVTRSIATQCLLIGDFENHCIEIIASIIGKANYFVDLLYEGSPVIEKHPLDHGCCRLPFPSLHSGKYTAILYEACEDSFGFGDTYSRIGEFQEQLLNPYDMRGRSFEIKEIIQPRGKLSLQMQFILNIKNFSNSTDHSTYEATMIVCERKLVPVATYPVLVNFFDYTHPNTIHLFFEEDGDILTFIYDAIRRIIVKEEDNVTRSERYRRFELLSEDAVFEVQTFYQETGPLEGLPQDIPTWSSQRKVSHLPQFSWKTSAK